MLAQKRRLARAGVRLGAAQRDAVVRRAARLQGAARADTDVTRVLPASAEIERAFDLDEQLAARGPHFRSRLSARSGEGVATCARACSSRLKPSVFDPQGRTIADALHSLGYGGVEDVRQGKYFELDLATRRGGARRGALAAEVADKRARQSGHRKLSHRGGLIMKFGIVVFPGSNCDHDAVPRRASTSSGQEAEYLWHKDTDLKGATSSSCPAASRTATTCATGAMARFSPIMGAVRAVRRSAAVRCSASATAFRFCSRPGSFPARCCAIAASKLPLRARARSRRAGRHAVHGRVPASARCCGFRSRHGEGNYFAPPDADRVSSRPIDRSCFAIPIADGEADDEANPNGSVGAIAGLCNEARNVVGLMPHPERACESRLGGADGRVDLRCR